MPRLSVVVPIFNGTAFLPSFFDSLRAALPDASQIVLVDDGSTEPIWQAVPDLAEADSVVRLRNDTNLGYSAAVNRGLAAATGDIVVQLNTDLVLEPNCITAMVELIQGQPRVGVVGSKLVTPTTGLVQHVGMAFGDHTKVHFFAEMPAAHPLCAKTREVQIADGATVAMTRRVLDRLGPLSEEYFNQNEELEHCLLAVKSGYRNFVSAESVAYHWKSRSGPARYARWVVSDAIFWSRWGASYKTDLAPLVDEALDHVLREAPRLEALPVQLLDLSRGADQALVLDRLLRRWPSLDKRPQRYRQMNNPAERLPLPLLLPRRIVVEPTPFIYLVDRYRELEENALWFDRRRRVVDDEVIVDLTAAALRTSELFE